MISILQSQWFSESLWFSDFFNLKKKNKKNISRIEETNILIENPKTQNKNESNLNPQKKKLEFWDAYETTFHNLIGNMD